jgi:hypothetical protein
VIRKLLLVLVAVLLLLTALPARAQTDTGGVINTNYPKPGDTKAAPAINLLPPDYGIYSNMETDPVAITATERDAVLARLRQAIPGGIDIVSLNAWNDAKENAPVIQIVNNVPIAGATYTIFLPAGWKKSAKLPVLLSGNGAGVGNNQRLWKYAELTIPALVGQSSQPNRTGLIAAFSNAGGVESQGVDDHTLKSVGEFFKFIGQNGGDSQQAITAGGSRGGGTALMWAINPLNLPYNVRAVFADIPPTAYGTLSQRSVLTYPNLGYIYVAVTHVPNAYLYSSEVGPSKTNIRVLIGTNDPAEADKRSPIGLADKLKGKLVVIGRGTHDAFFPLWEFLRFDRKLDELSIPHTTLITLGQGHSYTRALTEYLQRYTDALSQGKTFTPPTGRFYYINQNPPDGTQVALAAFQKDGLNANPDTPATSGDLPFAAEFAAFAGVGNPVDVALCGKNGAAYTYSATSADGKVWTQGNGTFTAEECVQTTIKAPDQPGEYVWEFTYNGKTVPSVNTPLRNQGGCGLPAITTISKNQPSPSEIVGDAPSLSFGVDEFSAQDVACLVP